MKKQILTGLLITFVSNVSLADRGEDLIAALSSDDGAIRRSAYTGIEKKEISADLIPSVAALLDHENPDIARAASLALEGIVAPFTDAEGLREIASEALCDAIDATENDHWLFWLLSYTGEPNVCARLGKMFGTERFEDVILALEGIRGEASVNAIVRQLTKSEPPERVALLNALGELGGETAIAALLNQAAQPDPIGLAAIEALGKTGTPRARSIIEDRLNSTFNDLVFTAYLKTLEALPKEERAHAYQNLLTADDDPTVQTAALAGLANTGTDAAIRTLLKALYSDDPAIHGAARNGLISIESNNANRVLVAALGSAGPDTKGVMLDILNARDPAVAAPLLDEVLNNKRSNARLAAFTILSENPQPKYEKAIRDAAKNDSDTVKPTALRAYLALASVMESDSKNALRMYKDVFDLATQNKERRDALQGMGRTGGVTTLAALQRYQDIPGIGDAISQSAMAIAGRIAESRPKIAERVYEGVAQRGALHLAQQAVDGLRAMGIDRDFAREAGFITQWKLIGPFPNEGLETPAPPETEFSENAEYDGLAGKKVRWTNVRTPHIRGILDLLGLFDPNQNTIAYARAELNLEEGGDALLLVGSDDGIACWLNGEQVHANEIDRGLAIDADQVPITLVPGENVLLLKITQGGGGWGFCARLTDPDRKPLSFIDK